MLNKVKSRFFSEKKDLLFIILLILLLMVSCAKNPLETDKELNTKPVLSKVEFSAEDNGIVLYLNKVYSDEAKLIFERKTNLSFLPITLYEKDKSTFVDTTLDLEQDYNLVYRYYVEKNGKDSEYSNEQSYNYVSNILNKPSNLHCTVEELSGIRLSWQDNSGKETGYKIEKNSGLGFEQIADLAENSETYFDEIATIPTEPITIQYRIKAYNDNLESSWLETTANYSGIAAPTNLTVTDTTSYHFTITWQDNSSIETGYSVERKKDNGNYSQISLLPANSITFTDNLTELGEYFYRVRAKKDNLYSDYTNVVSHQVNVIIPTEGLVAYYPFNGNANDESGNGNDGTVYGATLTTDRFGNANKAYSFDGSNDYIDIGNLDSLNNAESLTISIWIKKNTPNRVEGFIGKWYSSGYSNNSFLLYNGEDSCLNKGRFTLQFSDNEDAHIDGNNILSTSEWIHFVGVWRGSDGFLALYKNGLLDNSEINIDSKGKQLKYHDAYTTKIGNWGYLHSGQYYFNGLIDDVRIYNRALSEEEIQALYNEGGWGN